MCGVVCIGVISFRDMIMCVKRKERGERQTEKEREKKCERERSEYGRECVCESVCAESVR